MASSKFTPESDVSQSIQRGGKANLVDGADRRKVLRRNSVRVAPCAASTWAPTTTNSHGYADSAARTSSKSSFTSDFIRAHGGCAWAFLNASRPPEPRLARANQRVLERDLRRSTRKELAKARP